MDLSSTTGNANPELLWLESVLVSRIDQFKHHKWKEGDVGYFTDYCLATSDVYAESFVVTGVTENRLLNTDEYDDSLYPSDVSFDELASIAVCYFKLKDKQTEGDFTKKEKARAIRQTLQLFFKTLMDKVRTTSRLAKKELK